MHLRRGFVSQGVAAKPGHRQCATSIHYAPITHLHSGRGRPVCVRGLARDILTAQAGQIEGDPLAFLDVTEAYWKALRLSKDEPERKGPTVVTVNPQGSLDHMDFDVILCGGTLGLMVAATLQRRGHRVAVVDKRLIQGRTQEWNISKGELMSLAQVGLLTEEELNSCIVSEFNPVRVGFAGGPEMWVNDCLNLGVSPRKLLDLIKAKFVEAGGVLMENHSFRSAEVVPGQGVRLTLSVGGGDLGPGDVNRPNGLGGNSSNMVGPFTPVDSTGATPSPARIGRRRMELNCQLLVDCMGHYSDVVKQMRGRAKPDGMCIVVGSCAEGFPSANNTFGDLLYTIDDAKDDMQMFWEAFPAEGGAARTTYMFSYSDAEPSRPNFETLLDEYFENLYKYQGVHANDLQFKRVLFGGFPCWNDGPLQPAWDHIVQVGDASATQSPLSFGGFGAMLRHLGRLTEGMDDALRCGALSRDELKCLHPYQPSLSCSWLFQRSMSIGVGQLHKATQQQQQQQQAQLTAGEPGTALARGALATAEPAFVQLPVNHVNEVLGVNFGVMKVLGDRVLRPFLQDTIQLLPLSLSMAGMMLANPIAITRVLFQVGPETLLSWFGHYFALVAYTTLHHLSTPVRHAVRGAAGSSQNQPDAQALRVVSGGTHESLRHSTDAGRSRSGYKLRRLLDAWEVGSGSDHAYHAASEPPRPPTDTFFRLPQLPQAKTAPAVAATAAASQGQGPAVLAPATVMMSQTQPEISQRY